MFHQFQYKEPIFRVNNLSRVIDEKVIIKNINLEIRDIVRPGTCTGQIVSILGPSGRGKSQLLNTIAGLLTPTTGEVLTGSDLTPVYLGEMGMVQQHYPLFNHRTVLGNLEVANRDKANKEKPMEMLRIIGMEEYKDKYPAQLSGGQRQRVAIIQQVLCSQQFLLLDEPVSGLDYQSVRILTDLLRKIADLSEFNTIILVSHNIQFSVEISDMIFTLGKSTDGTEGATIRNSYNLVDMGLAWDQQGDDHYKLVRQLEAEMLTL